MSLLPNNQNSQGRSYWKSLKDDPMVMIPMVLTPIGAALTFTDYITLWPFFWLMVLTATLAWGGSYYVWRKNG